MSEKRRCTKTTKVGKPCKATPLKGEDFCLAHAPAETRESTGFVADNGKGGRKPIPRATEVARRLVEQNIVAVQRPYWRTLGYDVEIGKDGPYLVKIEGGGAKIYGESKDGDINMTEHDDLGAMMTASEKLQDRSFGRPKQATEITGAGGEPLHPPARIPDDDDYHRQVAEVLVEAEVIKLSAERNGSRNGYG